MEQRTLEQLDKNKRSGLFFTAIGWGIIVALYYLLKG